MNAERMIHMILRQVMRPRAWRAASDGSNALYNGTALPL